MSYYQSREEREQCRLERDRERQQAKRRLAKQRMAFLLACAQRAKQAPVTITAGRLHTHVYLPRPGRIAFDVLFGTTTQTGR